MKTQPLTKAQIKAIQPNPFQPVIAYTRFKDQSIVPESSPYYRNPRFKKEWSFEGTHSFTLPDGTIEQRPGQYVIKQKRGLPTKPYVQPLKKPRC